MQYWVNINGIQSGPISRDELSQMSFNPDDTYIWHQGLEDWLPIADVDELSDIVAAAAAKFATKKAAEPIAEPAIDGAEPAPEAPTEPAPASADSALGTPPPLDYHAPIQYAQAPQVPQSEQQPPKRPNTYIIWAIVVTLFCCQVTGVIAIIYGALSSAKYSSGDYAKAQSYSENAALWVQVSIALGLITTPLSICLSMLA